nr:stromal 70 kDa heat shock-related protein, chloroplastic-like [Tanacetum cinerariifolium]
MVNETEKSAKEDKEKHDTIDTKNQADSVVYHTEKQLKELVEKTIKYDMDAFNQKVMQLGQPLYNQPGTLAVGPSPGDAPGAESTESSGKGPEGDVTDVDFTNSK